MRCRTSDAERLKCARRREVARQARKHEVSTDRIRAEMTEGASRKRVGEGRVWRER
jgi:hypothetical protein